MEIHGSKNRKSDKSDMGFKQALPTIKKNWVLTDSWGKTSVVTKTFFSSSQSCWGGMNCGQWLTRWSSWAGYPKSECSINSQQRSTPTVTTALTNCSSPAGCARGASLSPIPVVYGEWLRFVGDPQDLGAMSLWGAKNTCTLILQCYTLIKIWGVDTVLKKLEI